MPLLAQTASQITPPSYAPPARVPGAPVTIPQDSGTQAPAGSDKVQVRLADIAITGGSVPPAMLAEAKTRLVGRTVTVADIFATAREIETSFARKGRVLTRVLVPAQSLADGATLKLVVVEGVIERIDTDMLPATVRRRVAAVLTPLVGKRDVTQAAIERRLLLAADVPGVALRSTLEAGAAAGSTVLVVTGRWQSVGGFATVDTTLPDSLGRTTYGLGVTFNSVLGAGETIYLRANGLPNTGRETSFLDPTPRNRALAGGIIVPLGTDGLTFNTELTDARTAPRHSPTLPGFASRFQRLSSRLRYPLVRTRALNVSAEATLDLEEERVRIIDPLVLPISLDQLRVARGAGEVAAYLSGGGVATARVEASFGLDALGARSAADATPALPLSRAGSDAGFRKLAISAGIDQPVARHLGLSVKARAQTAFGRAMGNAEQIGLATTEAISPLPSGTIQGDAGYVARAEVTLPFAASLPFGGAQLAPYGFGAVGGVRLANPTVFERRSTQACAYGAGLRVVGQAQTGVPGLSGTLEYGRAHLEGLGRQADRLTVSIFTRF